MTARDVRGRFVNADEDAATRLLERAVRRAVEELQPLADPFAAKKVERSGHIVTYSLTAWTDYQRDLVRFRVGAMLTAAGESAALLLDERPAKKAAARKGAS